MPYALVYSDEFTTSELHKKRLEPTFVSSSNMSNREGKNNTSFSRENESRQSGCFTKTSSFRKGKQRPPQAPMANPNWL